MIPPSFLQDLLARTDVADIVGRYVTLKKAGINYKGLCPFHGEKSPSFIVSPTRQTYHCFGCGVHGNALGFLMEYGGLGFIDAVKDLAQIQGMQVPDDDISAAERDRQKQVKEKQNSLTDVMRVAAQHWKQQLKKSQRAIDYLKSRGLSGEIAAHFALGYAPDNWRGLASAYPKYDDPLLVEAGLVIQHEPQDGEAEGKRYDRFRDRIMFPIRNPQGQVIGFGGRILDKGEPKYLNSPETPVFIKGRELYGLFEGRAALRNKGYAIVTEGYMDVVALAQWGFGNTVATLGTACTAEHAQKLFRFTDQVVFSFDGDAAGRRAAGRALEAVLPFATDTRRISFLFLPSEHDPDSYIREFGADAFEACIKKAVPLSKQILEHASVDCDLDSAEGRARLLTQAIPLLAQFPSGALQGLIADELAQQARTDPAEVRRRLTEQQTKAGKSHTGSRGSDGSVMSRRTDHDGPPVFDEHEGGHDTRAIPTFEPDGGNEAWSDVYAEQSQAAYTPPEPLNRWGKPFNKSWKSGGNSRWQRQGSPVVMRPPPQAATPLDRIVWALVSHSEFWDQLPRATQDLLCDQTAPYGEFFRWLDHTTLHQGPMARADLIQLMTLEDEAFAESPEMAHLRALARRIAHFHELPDDQDTVQNLVYLVKPIELTSLNEELNLLLESGELSEAAENRKKELFKLTTVLKLEISQHRPISG